MESFEQIAIADLKFRVVIVASTLAFSTVFVPLNFGLQSKMGMQLGVVLGVVSAVATAYFTVKRLP
ncbi:hypothetical protein [Halosolutus halophilus]|uniref:hypothetical protein n=1 Tax=Halosolutus halophilus TaxID=1552990 RepID=UPI00223513FA|nr:hypothetical protein [Halosolutus halophilus]